MNNKIKFLKIIIPVIFFSLMVGSVSDVSAEAVTNRISGVVTKITDHETEFIFNVNDAVLHLQKSDMENAMGRDVIRTGDNVLVVFSKAAGEDLIIKISKITGREFKKER